MLCYKWLLGAHLLNPTSCIQIVASHAFTTVTFMKSLQGLAWQLEGWQLRSPNVRKGF